MRDKRYFLNALTLCLLSACSTLREGRRVAATEEVPVSAPSAEELEVGEITFVRGTAESPFVLVTLKPGVRLPDGVRLQATSEDATIAHLKTTRERRDGFQMATILSGRPRRGDPVVLRYPKGDGTDPEDLEEWEEIPPLLRRSEDDLASGDRTGTGDSRGRPETTAPRRPAPGRDRALEAGSDDDDGDGPIPASALEPPETTDDVEPRLPSREMVPLELPTRDPDEGDAFIQAVD